MPPLFACGLLFWFILPWLCYNVFMHLFLCFLLYMLRCYEDRNMFYIILHQILVPSIISEVQQMFIQMVGEF